jgi:hypothetical protein
MAEFARGAIAVSELNLTERVSPDCLRFRIRKYLKLIMIPV